jgi:hypothetical protein
MNAVASWPVNFGHGDLEGRCPECTYLWAINAIRADLLTVLHCPSCDGVFDSRKPKNSDDQTNR